MAFVYIVGSGHSGSTLLDLMLGRHSRIVSAGELSALPLYLATDRPCSCGVTLRQCPFWSGVLARMAPSVIVGGERDARTVTILDNAALYGAIREISGASLVVDSSKGRRRLARLIDSKVETRVIHLVRDGRAVAYSHTRKGRSFWRYLVAWDRKQSRTDAYLDGLEVDRHVYVQRYTDLVVDPGGSMNRILAWLGMAREWDDWTEFARPEIHNLDGNSMRFSPRVRVAFDDTFLRRIPAWQWAASSTVIGSGLRRYGYPILRGDYLAKLAATEPRRPREAGNVL